MCSIDEITKAFVNTPHPGSRFEDISTTADDEGIYAYFVDSEQFNHDVKNLHYHAVALSFFTDAAFRYWLPAFMIAELHDPIEADIIADSIAYHLSDAQGAHARICAFSESEIESIKKFLTACSNKYNCENCTDDYQKALDKIAKANR